jgi:hypothetical protein
MAMTFKRTYKPRTDGFGSDQEKALVKRYPEFPYQPKVKLPYVVDTYYKPDFFLGYWKNTERPVYVEAKEWFNPQEIKKYELIVDQNPQIILVVIAGAIKFPVLQSLNKNARIFAFNSYSNIPTELLLNVRQTPLCS